ncbi:MAG: hypothetical protein EZS28_012906 [Streblomastix strix]|uniref:Uncharacterized protein n=1 Tax=Streblomastix strix TaxID=222440 RepID=A0A5J4W9M7_9EUKA|nr:MAG: hypothetical protein EZS28_012906 [Streblomastix strix]
MIESVSLNLSAMIKRLSGLFVLTPEQEKALNSKKGKDDSQVKQILNQFFPNYEKTLEQNDIENCLIPREHLLAELQDITSHPVNMLVYPPLGSQQASRVKTPPAQQKKSQSPSAIQSSQAVQQRFDPIKAQSEIEYKGQDFAEVERIIPVESLYPSEVLEREVKMIEFIQRQIKRDKNFARDYENTDLLNARREKSKKYCDNMEKDYESGLLTEEKYLMQLKDVLIVIKSKLDNRNKTPANSDVEKRRKDGIVHHLQGILMVITNEIETASQTNAPM